MIIYIRGSKNYGSCDLVLSNLALNEIVWFLARSNALSLWIFPVLYVFMPPIKCLRKRISQLKKKLKIRESNRRSDLNYDGADTNGNDSYLTTDDCTDDDYDDSDLEDTRDK